MAAPVRLKGGDDIPHQGRVEVFFNRTWGTVCDNYWDLKDANVVCGQLGFEGAEKATHWSDFGQGNGRIWMDNVQCIGNESYITDCDYNGWEANNCNHGEDAGAVCMPGNKNSIPSFTVKRF